MALEFMDLVDMTDAGMYTWAGIILVVTVVASYFVAIWWQRFRERQRT